MAEIEYITRKELRKKYNLSYNRMYYFFTLAKTKPLEIKGAGHYNLQYVKSVIEKELEAWLVSVTTHKKDTSKEAEIRLKQYLTLNQIQEDYNLPHKYTFSNWRTKAVHISTRIKKVGKVIYYNKEDVEDILKFSLLSLQNVVKELNISKSFLLKKVKEEKLKKVKIGNSFYFFKNDDKKLGLPKRVYKEKVSYSKIAELKEVERLEVMEKKLVVKLKSLKIVKGKVLNVFKDFTFLFKDSKTKETLDCKLIKSINDKEKILSITSITGNFISSERGSFRPQFYIKKYN